MIIKIQTGTISVTRFIIPSIVFYKYDKLHLIQIGFWKWTLDILFEKI